MKTLYGLHILCNALLFVAVLSLFVLGKYQQRTIELLKDRLQQTQIDRDSALRRLEYCARTNSNVVITQY